jgi:hypothetical protein
MFQVVPILACASLFQLEGLMDQCYSIIEETINVQVSVLKKLLLMVWRKYARAFAH